MTLNDLECYFTLNYDVTPLSVLPICSPFPIISFSSSPFPLSFTFPFPSTTSSFPFSHYQQRSGERYKLFQLGLEQNRCLKCIWPVKAGPAWCLAQIYRIFLYSEMAHGTKNGEAKEWSKRPLHCVCRPNHVHGYGSLGAAPTICSS